jgi:hypothetical protein
MNRLSMTVPLYMFRPVLMTGPLIMPSERFAKGCFGKAGADQPETSGLLQDSVIKYHVKVTTIRRQG